MTYRQALTGLSWLSFSRPPFSWRYPNAVKHPAWPVARTQGSPRRHVLNELALKRVTNPTGGFGGDLSPPHLLRIERLGSQQVRTEFCPHRPPSSSRRTIESNDGIRPIARCCHTKAATSGLSGLLRRALVELDEATLMASSSTGTAQ